MTHKAEHSARALLGRWEVMFLYFSEADPIGTNPFRPRKLTMMMFYTSFYTVLHLQGFAR